MIKNILFFSPLLLAMMATQAQVSSQNKKALENEQEKLMRELEKNPAMRAQFEILKKDTAAQRMLKYLDSLKKEHPELGIITPGFLSEDKTESSNPNSKNSDTYAYYYPLPQQHLNNHAQRLPVLKAAGIKALAQNLITRELIPNLNIILKKKLDNMVKDPTLNVAGTGTFYLLQGLSTDASGYLIAKEVAMHPTDPYAANNLGVFFRDKNKVEQALQCFFYADNLLPDSIKSPYVYANIGWASFYYGDFISAQKYFDKSLSISKFFKPAMEGQATLAYSRGDTKTLFECLAKELLSMTKTAGGPGGSGSGPSSGFSAICGGAFSEQEENNESANHGTNDSSPFDNLGKVNQEPEQDPPPGADVTFPAQFKPVFINDVKEGVMEAISRIVIAQSKAEAIVSDLHKKQKQLNPSISACLILMNPATWFMTMTLQNFLISMVFYAINWNIV